VRWLLRKDLLILGRSRLLLTLLIVYPVAIALLIGLAISRSPSRPRVAIVDETPPGETVKVGDQRVLVSEYARQLFREVQAVDVASRAQAVAKVESGAVLAAVVIPPDIAARIASDTEAALEQSLVASTLNSALAQANLAFSAQIQQAAGSVIGSLLSGGNLGSIGGVGGPEKLIGLTQIPPTLGGVIARQPRGHDRTQLERIDAFAGFAAQNLSLARRVLSIIGQPIRVDSVLLHGRRTPLNTFAVVVAVSLSLMLVCVLLAAGGVALEREEHTLARLIGGPRGPRGLGGTGSPTGGRASGTLITREALLVEKTLLAAGCAFVLAFAMLAGIGVFVTLDWGRVGQWLAALALGAVAFASLGVAIGALAREVRAASLLAFLLSLPLAFLALVPAGSVSGGFYDIVGAISFVFPFKAALQALDAAVNGASPAIGLPLVHLAVLAAVFGALARVGLRSVE
jgi:ABC-2 type transport system permease protein